MGIVKMKVCKELNSLNKIMRIYIKKIEKLLKFTIKTNFMAILCNIF
jgi:hypothetical protein